ncbi:C-C motif chemokine 20a.3 isoform X1 [Chanos chanos]|uniref:C-C motif chemokine n=1 Tax=Chanos chanos TaxID=29144 RepID=A0A6J2VAU5_CHACN|nr:C-C motif chemokine 20-like isoform X1 [Chanos chanos]
MAHISAPALVFCLILSVCLFSQQASALACCRKYSRGELPIGLIRGYSIQTLRKICNIDAIIFHTPGGKNVCADPAKPWVMDRIRILRERAQALRNKKNRAQ